MTKFKLNLLFPLICLTLSLLFPAACMQGVKNGLSLSLYGALPSLFPSLVLSAILTKQKGFCPKKPYLIPFFLGLFCGFPVGAASVSALVREGTLSRKDGEKLLFFCNNAGPAFLISYCGGSILQDPRKGLFLYLLQCAISSFCLFLSFGKHLFHKDAAAESKEGFHGSAASVFPSALRDGMNSFLYIMSCIIFFSFLSELISSLLSLRSFPRAVLGIFLELCGGLKLLQKIPSPLAFPLCALACGWGGLSVHLQTAGILQESKIGIKYHLPGKIFFAAALFSLTLFLQKLL